MSVILPEGERPRRRQPGPLPALPTRRVMAPLVLLGASLALLVGLNAPTPPAFKPLGRGGDGLALELTDPTPAASRSLEASFVPAGQRSRQRVLARLDEFKSTWGASSPRISVTPLDIGAGTVEFARQLDDWFGEYGMRVDAPTFDDALGEVSHPPPGSGFVIRCRKADRAIARELALAISPVVRGEVSILFSARAQPSQLDVFIEGAPRFNTAGVAYFPAADLDA